MVFRITYDEGAAHDATPYPSLDAALQEIRRAISNGTHTSATITCVSDDGPDRTLEWDEVQRHL